MRQWVADLETIAPLEQGDNPRAFVARAPRRLGIGDQSVAVRLLGRRPGTLARAAAHLRPVAAAAVPGMVRIWELGQEAAGDEPEVYLITDYCEGGSLTSAARGDRAVLRSVAEAARVINRLHDSGVAHGDIRPATLLKKTAPPSPGGPWLVGAPTRPAAAEPGQTASARPGGRVAAVDPAVLRGNPPSRASDIWALAVTAHFAFTGRWVHSGIENDDPLTAVQRILFEPPVPDESLTPGDQDVFRRSLSPDPIDRPASAAALADELDALSGAVR
jgi:serine/threonine protein kinase